MIKKGTLRASIHVISANSEEIIIGSNLPYARVHNQGGTFNIPGFIRKTKNGTTSVKAHTRTYPQRKFIGDSESLNRKITALYKKSISNALKIKL
jgi:phage gpG-like protein